LGALLQAGLWLAQVLKLGFDLLDVPLQAAHQALGLATQVGRGEGLGLLAFEVRSRLLAKVVGRGEGLGLLALGHQEVQQLGVAADQFGQVLLALGPGRGGLGLEGLAVGGQDGGVQTVGLGAPAWARAKCRARAGFRTLTGGAWLVESGHPVAFVAAGGFTDDLSAGLAGQPLQPRKWRT